MEDNFQTEQPQNQYQELDEEQLQNAVGGVFSWRKGGSSSSSFRAKRDQAEIRGNANAGKVFEVGKSWLNKLVH